MEIRLLKLKSRKGFFLRKESMRREKGNKLNLESFGRKLKKEKEE